MLSGTIEGRVREEEKKCKALDNFKRMPGNVIKNLYMGRQSEVEEKKKFICKRKSSPFLQCLYDFMLKDFLYSRQRQRQQQQQQQQQRWENEKKGNKTEGR